MTDLITPQEISEHFDYIPPTALKEIFKDMTTETSHTIEHTIELTIIKGTKLKETIEVPAELHIIDDAGEIPATHNRMFRILSQEKGDERITWDSRSLADIRAAKEMFISFIKKGLKPFKVGLNGKATAEVMREFDPLAEEVIFLPHQLVAGG